MRTVGRDAAERAAFSIGDADDGCPDDDAAEERDEGVVVVDKVEAVRCARHGTTPNPLLLPPPEVLLPPTTPYLAASSDEMVVVSPTLEVYSLPGA